MEARGWTDYRLAKESNLSHSTVTNMFNRNNAPTLPTLEAVCKAFGITLAQFFSECDDTRTAGVVFKVEFLDGRTKAIVARPYEYDVKSALNLQPGSEQPPFSKQLSRIFP